MTKYLITCLGDNEQVIFDATNGKFYIKNADGSWTEDKNAHMTAQVTS
jgi:hypothetical protein